MLTLSAKKRTELGRKVNNLREKDVIPAVLYGPKLKNLILEVDLKEFKKVYQGAGESSLIQVLIEEKKHLVLIQAVEIDSVSQKPIHIDFYQPRLDEEITATVPLVFEGEAPAVKNLSGTLVKNIYELEVKALPQSLPHEIKVDINGLKTFDDAVLVKDLVVPKEVKVLKAPEETICFVSRPEDVEQELAKPMEEEKEIEEIEKVEDKEDKEDKEEGSEKQEIKKEKK
jgi:large subunit ribosomal protein L25